MIQLGPSVKMIQITVVKTVWLENLILIFKRFLLHLIVTIIINESIVSYSPKVLA